MINLTAILLLLNENLWRNRKFITEITQPYITSNTPENKINCKIILFMIDDDEMKQSLYKILNSIIQCKDILSKNALKMATSSEFDKLLKKINQKILQQEKGNIHNI